MQRISPEPRRAHRAERAAASDHFRPLAPPPGPMMGQLNAAAADPGQARPAARAPYSQP